MGGGKRQLTFSSYLPDVLALLSVVVPLPLSVRPSPVVRQYEQLDAQRGSTGTSCRLQRHHRIGLRLSSGDLR